MKLSHKKRIGMRYVVASRIVEVLKTHPVSTRGVGDERAAASVQHREAFGRGTPGRLQMFAQPGDLAMDLIDGKTDEPVGLAYLSGEAIQVVNYEPVPEDWVKPLGVRFCLAEEGPENLVGIATASRYPVVFKNATTDPTAYVRKLVAAIALAKPDTRVAGSGLSNHLIGIVGRRKHRMKLHFQPERHAGPLACSFFQASVLVAWGEREANRRGSLVFTVAGQ